MDWYYRKTTDLINSCIYVSQVLTSATRLQATSVLCIIHGFELATIRSDPYPDKRLEMEINYNLTHNKNKIDELVGGNSAGYLVETGGVSAGTGSTIQAHAVDHSASAFYVYQQAYDKNGNPLQNTYVDRNGNGYIDSGDRYFYYKPALDVTMGFGFKVDVQELGLSCSMRCKSWQLCIQ